MYEPLTASSDAVRTGDDPVELCDSFASSPLMPSISPSRPHFSEVEPGGVDGSHSADLIATFRALCERRRKSQVSPHGDPLASILRLWEQSNEGDGNPCASPLTAEDKSVYLADAVHMTSSAVDAVLARSDADAAAALKAQEKLLAKARSKKGHASVFDTKAGSATEDPAAAGGTKGHPLAPPVREQAERTSLPQRLDMPLSNRCSFCRKHDSMCSKDHVRWRAILDSRRERIAADQYANLPALKRRALVFLTAAYGTEGFAEMLMLQAPGARTRMQERVLLLPGPPQQCGGGAWKPAAELDALLLGTAVNPLHVAGLFSNEPVLRVLLSSADSPILPSANRIDPVECMTDATVSRLVAIPRLHGHVLDLSAYLALLCGDAAQTQDLAASFLSALPDDARAHWWKAAVLLLLGKVQESHRSCGDWLREQGAATAAERAALKGLMTLASMLKAPGKAKFVEAARSPEVVRPEPPVLEASLVKPPRPVTPPPDWAAGSFPIRRVPFSAITAHLLPFCDADVLWALHQCTPCPLLRLACVAATRRVPGASFTGVLMRMHGFLNLLQDAAARQPSAAECTALGISDAPVKPLGVLTVQADGFNWMVVKVSASAKRSVKLARRTLAEQLYEALMSGSDESDKDQELSRQQSHAAEASVPQPSEELRRFRESVDLVVSRQFQISRADPGAAWDLTPVGAWTEDPVATTKLVAFIKRRSEAQSQ